MTTGRPHPLDAWTIGDLSRTSGLTHRVLRHWEKVGVITAERGSTGHRRYLPLQATRLYRALALRRAGLGLTQVAALLDEQDPDPVATLRSHVATIDADLRRRSQVRDRLVAVLQDLDHPREQPPDDHDDDPAPADRTLMRVIETMMMFEQYVHGYDGAEHARLQDQADTLVDLVHHGVSYEAGARVVEVGCGVGAQTLTLLERNPGIDLTAVDLSDTSLAAARSRVRAAGHHGVRFVQADLMEAPTHTGDLRPGTFDHVFVCFVLENLVDPATALRHLRCLLRPGGTITVVEGDHGSTYFHPDSRAAREAVDCQVQLQRLAGGDALVGRRLYPLLDAAGFRRVEITPRQVYVDGSRPQLAEGFTTRTFIAMIEGVRQQAVAAGLLTPERFDEGLRDLRRTTEADGVFCYTFFAATATVAHTHPGETTPHERRDRAG